MERGWIMWLPPLLLLFLSMVTPFAPAQTLSYRNLVNRFIINYNKKSVSGNLFRLLALNLPPGINNDPSIPHPLNFTIMETVCPKTKPHNLDECNFKENGMSQASSFEPSLLNTFTAGERMLWNHLLGSYTALHQYFLCLEN
ncbi:protegrin-2-like isoform X2 [Sminthopsis crassicaudata]|uniref:protegrin-2-like isoform X2 n=1 Tax=Sminthopsis crassicaudata TaxID=9301 RepID=UPI003D68E8AE